MFVCFFVSEEADNLAPSYRFRFSSLRQNYEFFRDDRQVASHGFALETDRGGELMVWHVWVLYR